MSKHKKFIKNYKKSKYPKSSKEVGCGEGLSGEICEHNNAKLNKSEAGTYNFQNAHAVIPAEVQHAAETTAYAPLVKYIKSSIKANISKIKFEKGTLTLSQKDRGIYEGFFQDKDGEVIEEFTNVTPEIVAKNLEVKELYDRPEESAPGPADDEAVREMAREEAEAVMDDTPKSYVKIKYGDLELEIRKSVSDFVNTFRKAKMSDAKPNYIGADGIAANHAANSFIRSYKMKDAKKKKIRKALRSWARNTGKKFDGDLHAARELLADWEKSKEEFQQILYAMQQVENEKKGR